MKVKKHNDEVLYSLDQVVKVDKEYIESLKEAALLNERKRIRLCSHKNDQAKIHEMFIIHQKDAYVRPHKHINKIESFHIIEGIADVVLFDDDGRIKEVIEMGDFHSGKKFYFRISDPLFHTVIIKSESLVFHEITKGPFNKIDTIFAQWSPDERDVDESRIFLDKLKDKI